MPASGQRAFRGYAMFARGIWWTCVALAALFPLCGTYAQELNGVALQFLQRHGVPCLFVLTVGSTNGLDEVATCQDGRDWALLWIENEIAFVQPTTRDLYKWDRSVYSSWPELYGSKRTAYVELSVGDGP